MVAQRRNAPGENPRASASPRSFTSQLVASSLRTRVASPLGEGLLHMRRGIAFGRDPPGSSGEDALASSLAIFRVFFSHDTNASDATRWLPAVVTIEPVGIATMIGP